MKPLNYILDDDGNPVPEKDIMKWATWAAKADRRVAETRVGPVRISTVFLTHDHNWSGHGPPILWETMVFGGVSDGAEERYSSRADAEAGHARMVAKVRAAMYARNRKAILN